MLRKLTVWLGWDGVVDVMKGVQNFIPEEEGEGRLSGWELIGCASSEGEGTWGPSRTGKTSRARRRNCGREAVLAVLGSRWYGELRTRAVVQSMVPQGGCKSKELDFSSIVLGIHSRR